jgi:2-keto-4-pentenoate hydratase/2-oxohepta-3-ene-1,7-dioic acid hydratase in catechol pathway
LKFIMFLQDGRPRLGVLDGDAVTDLHHVEPAMPADLGSALQAGFDIFALARKALASKSNRQPLAGLSLAPLLPNPGKIICLGLNYYDHAKEGGRQKPDYPWFFTRTATSLVAHDDDVLCPSVSEQLDYEAELAAVIGKAGKHIAQERALDLVFGYSCFNDVSVRDYQKRTPQWTIGKNFDKTGGFGPVLVTADELPPGAAGLKIQGRLNGKVMQSANTVDMIWDVAQTISLLTECLTLEAGDVLVMGTPAGVGQSRIPPVWLKDGDRFEVEIERIGTLSNGVRRERTPA